MVKSKELYEVLQRKGISHFHHANTMRTSITFIRAGTLLSRQFVESKMLIQSEQSSDHKDKEFGVWDDVFLDGLDLHGRFRRPNLYGPVMFKIKLEILLEPNFENMYVTTNNPIYWKADSLKYYEDIIKIDQDYLTGNYLSDARIMFTIKSPEDHIRLDKFCDEIIVDNPNLLFAQTGERIVDRAAGKISKVLSESNLKHIPVRIRHEGISNLYCSCFFQYNYMNTFKSKELLKRFATPIGQIR